MKKKAKRHTRTPVRPWKLVSRRTLATTRIFTLREDRLRSPRTKKTHPMVALESPDWVNVVALTPKDEVVLIEQYRFGVRKPTIEIPGGLVDPGETPAQAAARELLEETGYRGDKAVEIGSIWPNPAIQDNVTWTYLIRNAKRVGEAVQEGTEDIACYTVPMSRVPAMIRRGAIAHALVVVAFTHYWLRQRGTFSESR